MLCPWTHATLSPKACQHANFQHLNLNSPRCNAVLLARHSSHTQEVARERSRSNALHIPEVETINTKMCNVYVTRLYYIYMYVYLYVYIYMHNYMYYNYTSINATKVAAMHFGFPLGLYLHAPSSQVTIRRRLSSPYPWRQLLIATRWTKQKDEERNMLLVDSSRF